MNHPRRRAALLLLLALLARGAIADVCPPPANVTAAEKFCTSITKVCVDQNMLVLYENAHNPRHLQYKARAESVFLCVRALASARAAADRRRCTAHARSAQRRPQAPPT